MSTLLGKIGSSRVLPLDDHSQLFPELKTFTDGIKVTFFDRTNERSARIGTRDIFRTPTGFIPVIRRTFTVND